MSTAEQLENHIINVLIQQQIISPDAKEEIAEKMDIGLTLGEVLIGDNYVSDTDLSLLLADIYRKGKITLEEIEEKFFIAKQTFLENFAKKYKMTYINLNEIDIDYRISERISLNQLKRFKALPVKEDDLNIYVALKEPFDINAQDRVQALFNRKLLKVVISDPEQIDRYLSKVELAESIKGIVADIRKELNSVGEEAVDSSNSSGILNLIETIVTCFV